MKELLVLLAFLPGWLLAQPKGLSARWATIKQLEAKPSGLGRDTLLVLAYTDFVFDLIKKEPPDSGLIYTDKAYTLAESRGWERGILLALSRKSGCLNIANRHYEALRAGLKGLKRAEQQHNPYFQGLFYNSPDFGPVLVYCGSFDATYARSVAEKLWCSQR